MSAQKPRPELDLQALREHALTFALRKNAVTIGEFERFVRDTKDVLKNVGRAASDVAPDWLLTDLRFGSAVMSFAPTALNDQSEGVESAILEGVRAVESASAKPLYFSERALSAVRRLGALAAGGVIDITGSQGKTASLTGVAVKNVDILLRPTRRYFGSVVGNLDVLSVHAKPFVTVYGDHGDVVRCFIDTALVEETAIELLGKRVIVSGEIRTNRLGNMVSIRGEELVEAPTRHNRSPRGTAGSIPDFTGGVSIAEFLSEIRGEAVPA